MRTRSIRDGFFRNSPRIVRRLFYLIAIIWFVELIILAVAVTAGSDWAWLAWQLCSRSAGPFAIGTVVVLSVRNIMNRRLQPNERHSASEDQQLPYEIRVARSTARALSYALRSREGRAAVRAAARLMVAANAAMRTSQSQREGLSNHDLEDRDQPSDRG